VEHPKSILRRHGLTVKKSLGQNFIYDDHLLSRIVAAAHIESGDQVLEIGPGLGSLTHFLASKANRVVALELDERLIPILAQELAAEENVVLVHGDILTFDLSKYFEAGFKVVGNLPYYITGAIFRKLLSSAERPELILVTVQKEVAERLVAQPGNMSVLSVMVQLYADVEMVFSIKAGAFWPRPEVDSAVVRLIRHNTPLVRPDEEEAFIRLVKTGFSQKRKQLQKNLRALGLSKAQLTKAFDNASIDGRRRAQSLSLREWRALYVALS
jgi:16S rRNA (adenine1518-N6/adenine1519-N6)-dimethyltransferase